MGATPDEQSATNTDTATDRDLVIERVLDAGRTLGLAQLALNASAAKMISSPPTDAWALSHLRNWTDETPPTAGDLARATRLTTGAITKVLDRLAGQGLIERQPHPSDRRKVVIVATPESDRVGGVFQPMALEFRTVVEKFETGDLRAILSYLDEAAGIINATITRMHDMPPNDSPAR